MPGGSTGAFAHIYCRTSRLRVGLLTKLHGFFRSLLDSPSHEVAVIARLKAKDVRNKLGK